MSAVIRVSFICSVLCHRLISSGSSQNKFCNLTRWEECQTLLTEWLNDLQEALKSDHSILNCTELRHSNLKTHPVIFMFIYCGLFSTGVSSSDCIILNDRLNNEFWIGKDLEGSSCGLIYLLSLHLPGGTEENHESLSQDSHCSSQDSNQAPHKHKSEALPVKPTCLVLFCH
jgi:hypothetical protein